MATEYTGVWIRIAGNAKRIKANLPRPHWRYEIEGHAGQHPLSSWTLLGEATSDNNTQGTNPVAQQPAFTAWVWYYGDVSISDSLHATIRLQPLHRSVKHL